MNSFCSNPAEEMAICRAYPPRTWTAQSSPRTRCGTAKCSVSLAWPPVIRGLAAVPTLPAVARSIIPSPSWSTSFAPHAQTSPDSVARTVWLAPQLASLTFRGTGLGGSSCGSPIGMAGPRWLAPQCPSPSCPRWFRPHDQQPPNTSRLGPLSNSPAPCARKAF